jgi:hypothetical protein
MLKILLDLKDVEKQIKGSEIEKLLNITNELKNIKQNITTLEAEKDRLHLYAYAEILKRRLFEEINR